MGKKCQLQSKKQESQNAKLGNKPIKESKGDEQEARTKITNPEYQTKIESKAAI